MGKLVDFFREVKKHIQEQEDEYKSQYERNIKDACKEMVLRAKETTPPKPGTERGTNTVTGNLAAHWGYKYDIKKNDTRITITNNVQYASYVDQGHKIKKHFVPWLHIDPFTKQLTRYIPSGMYLDWETGKLCGTPASSEKLFGIVVGTKTQEVDGYEMVDKARDRFFEAFYLLQSQTAESIGDKLNGNNH